MMEKHGPVSGRLSPEKKKLRYAAGDFVSDEDMHVGPNELPKSDIVDA